MATVFQCSHKRWHGLDREILDLDITTHCGDLIVRYLAKADDLLKLTTERYEQERIESAVEAQVNVIYFG